jgi:hypothetical protein
MQRGGATPVEGDDDAMTTSTTGEYKEFSQKNPGEDLSIKPTPRGRS